MLGRDLKARILERRWNSAKTIGCGESRQTFKLDLPFISTCLNQASRITGKGQGGLDIEVHNRTGVVCDR